MFSQTLKKRTRQREEREKEAKRDTADGPGAGKQGPHVVDRVSVARCRECFDVDRHVRDMCEQGSYFLSVRRGFPQGLGAVRLRFP